MGWNHQLVIDFLHFFGDGHVKAWKQEKAIVHWSCFTRENCSLSGECPYQVPDMSNGGNVVGYGIGCMCCFFILNIGRFSMVQKYLTLAATKIRELWDAHKSFSHCQSKNIGLTCKITSCDWKQDERNMSRVFCWINSILHHIPWSYPTCFTWLRNPDVTCMGEVWVLPSSLLGSSCGKRRLASLAPASFGISLSWIFVGFFLNGWKRGGGGKTGEP